MNYIVLDLEWNQSPQGKDYEEPSMPCEIIEIGAVRLDSNLCESGRFHQIIKPQVYKELHFMTKQIVHLTKAELRMGKEFPEAMAEFLEWCGEEFIFCTWGTMDLLELQRNMQFYGVEPFSNKPLVFYDIQKFFSLLYEDGKKRRTLQYAIEYCKLEENLEFHSALNDAIYTARVINNIDFDRVKKNYSLDCFHIPMNKKDEVHAVFDTYSKYISRGYETKDALLEKREVSSVECYICNRKCRKKIRWFSNNNGKTYLSLAMCPEHGYIKSKLRIKNSENELYYAVKTTKIVDEAGAMEVRDKKKIISDKKRERRKRLKAQMENA